MRMPVLTIILCLVAGCQTTGVSLKGEEIVSIDGVKVNVQEFRPEGKGPFPGAILLHNCTGWHAGNITDWGNFLAEQGFYVMAVDSHKPRGIYRDICGGMGGVSFTEIGNDAYATLDYMNRHPEINSSSVALMGFARGGISAARATENYRLRNNRDRDGKPIFAAAVLMYPVCASGWSYGEYYAPTLLIAGSEDGMTTGCLNTAKTRKGGGKPFETLSIEGATHEFDVFSMRGRPVRSRYWGGILHEPNREATEKARAAVNSFLQRILK